MNRAILRCARDRVYRARPRKSERQPHFTSPFHILRTRKGTGILCSGFIRAPSWREKLIPSPSVGQASEVFGLKRRPRRAGSLLVA
jgi:hypothetical protein